MKDRFIGKSMNKKKIISMILVASMAVSTITFADIEQDVLNAQAKYEEYQKNIEIFDSILNDTTIMGDYFSEGLLNYLNSTQRTPNMSRF